MSQANKTNHDIKVSLFDKLETNKMMRLRPSKRGKQGRPRRYYSKFRHEGESIEVPLDATEFEKNKAYAKLGEINQDLKNGIHPQSIRKRIKNLKIKVPIIQRNQEIAEADGTG